MICGDCRFWNKGWCRELKTNGHKNEDPICDKWAERYDKVVKERDELKEEVKRLKLALAYSKG